MWVRGIEGVAFVTLGLAAASGCTTKVLKPDLDVWTGIGVEAMTLFNRADGFWWQDPDVWDSADDVGVISVSGNQLTARGGICGHQPHYGECSATFSPPVVQVSVAQFDAPSLVFHLERVSGALEVRDEADRVLVSLKPRTAGADIFDRDGNFIDRADWDVEDPQRLWVATTRNALIGWSFGAVPAEIAALAQGAILQTSTNPAIPGHAVVIAAALTWLR